MNKKVYCPCCKKETECVQQGALKGANIGLLWVSKLVTCIGTVAGAMATTSNIINSDNENNKYRCSECGKTFEEKKEQDDLLD